MRFFLTSNTGPIQEVDEETFRSVRAESSFWNPGSQYLDPRALGFNGSVFRVGGHTAISGHVELAIPTEV